MPVTGFSLAETYKNSFQWRHTSGELDVFEAARYFSGANENNSTDRDIIAGPKLEQFFQKKTSRMSLDMLKRSPILPLEKPPIKADFKKCKQPSSPGSKLADFLNSLFNQKSSKNKKLKPKSNDIFMEESSGGRRRRRRSSISHFPISVSKESKPIFPPSSSSGFTTPRRPYANSTPTKSFEVNEVSDQPPENRVGKNEFCNENPSSNQAWTDEKFSFPDGISGKFLKNGSFEFPAHYDKKMSTPWGDNLYHHHHPLEEKGQFQKFSDDPGADSDCSSDLFELPNHGLDFCSSATDLPVYETTRRGSIERTNQKLLAPKNN